MIKYEENPQTGAFDVLVNEPARVDFRAYRTTICIIPNKCHGCGNCKLCGPGCTCHYQSTCGLANRCNSAGYCLNPANCTHGRA